MRGFSAIGLHNPKDAHNLGSVLRAAQVYSAAMVAVTGPRIKRHASDTMKAYRHLPLLHATDLKSVIPYDCVPVAIELSPHCSHSLPSYIHPERAFYIFGPEDSSLGVSVFSWCRDIVSIPTSRCMNLAATVNVVLYDRLAKYVQRNCRPNHP